MTETEKIDLLFEAVKYLADVWRRVGFPVTFDRSVRVRGVNVRVIIGDESQLGGKSALDVMRSETGCDM